MIILTDHRLESMADINELTNPECWREFLPVKVV